MRVPRFWCRAAGRSISLLPSFLAAGLRGTLDDVEKVVDSIERAPSLAAAAGLLRPAEAEHAVTSISASRWARRRSRAIRAALIALVTLVPALAGCHPRLTAIRARLKITRVLVTLRRVAHQHMASIARPLGFGTRERG